MISRSTAKRIAEAYSSFFSYTTRAGSGNVTHFKSDELYDFLYERSCERWLCNEIRRACRSSGNGRQLKEFIMMLHTGESVLKARKDLKLQDRQKLGEFFLRNLAAALIAGLPRLLSGSVRNQDWMRGVVSVVQADLELDGYLYKDGQLLQVEADVLDVQEESGVLQSLFQELHLNERETTFHHLTLSEEHYVSRRWDDCIGNARKFLELVLSEVSSKHCLSKNGKPLATKAYESPREVRDYLEQEGLLETREKEALAKIYGLLSHTGGHPYMAANEQARLLRHMALTFAQFVMLRLQGALAASAGKGLQPAEPQEGNVQ